MRFELTRYSIDRALKALENIKGKNITVGNMHLSGVDGINIEIGETYDSDPDPSIGNDGNKRGFITITFKYSDGNASINLCPDEQVCFFWHEEIDLICFEIQCIKEYVENERFELDFRLKEYEKYMSK